ncbi:hypothetical protein SCLCIDRAFT_25763 [Scleroderma citrinum Foug A]|uniref:Uncharacterized protein n=1 Tax=Scleroderma citrinum Foug A TaxID=1036808 RepID=A0A0C3DLW7_9AGAM|nr:hypothetical protein SCLCIDRAFT_25763 [Scleroderma citrinum Foug A]
MSPCPEIPTEHHNSCLEPRNDLSFVKFLDPSVNFLDPPAPSALMQPLKRGREPSPALSFSVLKDVDEKVQKKLKTGGSASDDVVSPTQDVNKPSGFSMDKQVRCSSQYTCLQTAEHVVWMKKAHTEKRRKQRGFGPVSSNQDQIHIMEDNGCPHYCLVDKYFVHKKG